MQEVACSYPQAVRSEEESLRARTGSNDVSNERSNRPCGKKAGQKEGTIMSLQVKAGDFIEEVDYAHPIQYYERATVRTKWLTGTKIDDDARTVFTQGQCHAIAIALHNLMGWAIVLLYVGGSDSGWHFVAESPWGLVDIDGLGVESRYDILETSPTSVGETLWLVGHWGMFEPNLEVAAEYAALVVKQVSNTAN
jgi:hypothetical protein